MRQMASFVLSNGEKRNGFVIEDKNKHTIIIRFVKSRVNPLTHKASYILGEKRKLHKTKNKVRIYPDWVRLLGTVCPVCRIEMHTTQKMSFCGKCNGSYLKGDFYKWNEWKKYYKKHFPEEYDRGDFKRSY